MNVELFKNHNAVSVVLYVSADKSQENYSQTVF